jgi:hypothetical protein
MPVHQLRSIRARAADPTYVSRIYLSGGSVFSYKPDVPGHGARSMPDNFNLRAVIPREIDIEGTEIPSDRWHTPHPITCMNGLPPPVSPFHDAASFAAASLASKDHIAGDGPTIIKFTLGLTTYTKPKVGVRVDIGPIDVLFPAPTASEALPRPKIEGSTLAMFGVPAATYAMTYDAQ